MARAFGIDLRRRVIGAIEAGLSTRAAARRFAIGESTAGAWHRHWRKTGSYEARRQGGRNGSILDAHEGFLMDLIEKQADITLAEMAARLEEDRSVRVDPSTIWYFLNRRGITFKKRPRTRPSKSVRMS